MTGEITLDATAMGGIATDLDGVKDALTGQRSSIAVHPDAGSSSQEVADAFTAFGTVLEGLAGSLGEAASGVRSSVAGYQQSDQRSGGRMGGPR